MATLDYRTQVGGVDVEVRDQETLDALFVELGGRVVSVSDKGVEMEFASKSDADRFKVEAKTRGAIFGSSL